ncbi:hypothetical protein CDIK_4105 [Cucumispora dikerogammari]|nr:hypothetical protein CDIK_4105 [Cucumispora dikerogammari]
MTGTGHTLRHHAVFPLPTCNYLISEKTRGTAARKNTQEEETTDNSRGRETHARGQSIPVKRYRDLRSGLHYVERGSHAQGPQTPTRGMETYAVGQQSHLRVKIGISHQWVYRQQVVPLSYDQRNIPRHTTPLGKRCLICVSPEKVSLLYFL